MTLLAVEKLYKHYDGLQAVDGVSFELDAGELLALIGPNGAGKTTCFNMVNGQVRPNAGRVTLAGADITGLEPRRVWRAGVGRTFQITTVFKSMSVVENVQVALSAYHRRSMSLWGRAPRLYRDEAMALLERVGMASQWQRPCSVLAYGDLKRVDLAMALANRPRILLMDEPTAGMGPGERAALMELTVAIVQRDSIGVLFTEHDMDLVFGLADRIVVLDRGRMVAAGKPAEIRVDVAAQQAYLGTAHSL
jgi:branched-chain amino acid transport system ATP-binding protein